MKFGSERPEMREVLERDHNRCVACGVDLKCALSVHHRKPKEPGGRDTLSNLTTLCVNCHKIVHWLSVAERLEGPEGNEARQNPRLSSAFAKLRELAEVIRDHRLRTRRGGNRLLEGPDTDGPMPLADALILVSRRNHFDQRQAAMLQQVVERVLDHLAANVRKGCSTSLVQKGHFFSIKAGNTLVFRTQGFFDGKNEADGDVLLIWPETTRISVLSPAAWRPFAQGESSFAALSELPCFNLPLSFEQALKMREADWMTFAHACGEAVRVEKTRHWVSNVALPA
jgi:hypothetical protein